MRLSDLDLADPSHLDNLRWALEKKRCEDDFEYLAGHYLRIKAKDVIGFPPLRFNRVQRYLLGKMQAQWKRDGWIRQVWGKSRQIGASTLVRGMSFHQTAFKNNRNAFMVTHDEPSSYELFDMDQTFYDALPDPLKPKTSHRAKARMVFPGRNSKVLIGHALNMNVGASQMNHFVHLTEVARYRNAEEIQASLFPSISAAKGEECSVVVIESTSRYGGEWFKDFYDASARGETGFEANFVPYMMHEAYTAPVPRGFQPTHEERDLLKRHPGMTHGNLVWRRLAREQYRTNPALFEQEYPLSWEESWVMPKGTMRVFTEELLEPYYDDLTPGQSVTPTSTGLQAELGGPVVMFAPPERDIFYDMSVDPALGANSEADWIGVEVIRRDTLEQVAEMRIKMDPASPEFYNLVYWIGMNYNRAQMIVDITGGWGHALLGEMQRRSYPNLWQSRRRDDAKQRISNRVGFLFTPRDKRTLVTNAVTLLSRREGIIHSALLMGELRDYLSIGLDEWGAGPGAHDDLATAWMLALLAARDERVEWLMVEAPVKDVVLPEPHKRHDIDADLKLPGEDDAAVSTIGWGVR